MSSLPGDFYARLALFRGSGHGLLIVHFFVAIFPENDLTGRCSFFLLCELTENTWIRSFVIGRGKLETL